MIYAIRQVNFPAYEYGAEVIVELKKAISDAEISESYDYGYYVEGTTTITFTANYYALASISSDLNSPTTIASSFYGGVSLLAYRDTYQILHLKLSGAGANGGYVFKIRSN